MDKIILTTTPSAGLTDSLLQRMFHVYKNTPDLSARSKKEIKGFYQKEEIIFIEKGSQIIGWLIRSPLSPSLYEISGVYVEENFRLEGISTTMLRKALEPQFQYTIVTFIPDFAEFLMREYCFRKSSLYEIVRLSKWTLALKRFHLLRIVSIIKHLSTKRAYYLLRENQHE